MFKRKTLILIILFITFFYSICFAKIVSQDEAKSVSLKWIKIENDSQNLRLTKKNFSFAGISDFYYKGEKSCFIVNLNPSGFIIIPAITEFAPVKFVSYGGSYKEMKNHPFIKNILSEFYYSLVKLGYLKKQVIDEKSLSILSEISINFGQICKNKLIWEHFISKKNQTEILYQLPKAGIGPLLTSTWGQRYPYNIYTPKKDGKNTPAGCTAVAMAQLMYYWKYPSSGQGKNSYQWNYQILNANFVHPYYWNNMFNGYTGVETNSQKEAVARLIYDVGISVNMDYDTDGSSARINSNNALVNNFKYSDDIKGVDLSGYNSNEEFQMIKTQIDKGWPVLLSIYKDDEGHAIVSDGYRVQGNVKQLHVNMGWNGSEDNYYTLDSIADGWKTSSLFKNVHPLENFEINIVKPMNGDYLKGVTELWVNGNDCGEIVSNELYIDNVKHHVTQKASYIYKWNTLEYENTSHNIKAIAYDDKGNTTEDTINVNVFNIDINLNCTRKIESSWLIKREYGEINIEITESGPVSSLNFIIYRKKQGEDYQNIEEINGSEFASGNYTYYDKFLEKNKSYSYKVKVLSPDGIQIAVSNEENI